MLYRGEKSTVLLDTLSTNDPPTEETGNKFAIWMYADDKNITITSDA